MKNEKVTYKHLKVKNKEELPILSSRIQKNMTKQMIPTGDSKVLGGSSSEITEKKEENYYKSQRSNKSNISNRSNRSKKQD